MRDRRLQCFVIFFFTGTLLMGVAHAAQNGIVHGLAVGVFTGVIVGSLGALWTHFVLWSKGEDPKSGGVLKSRTFQVPQNYDEVFELCQKAVRAIPRYITKVEASKTDRSIRARATYDLKYGSHDISLQIEQIGETATEVTVTSRPANKFALWDDGGNKLNIDSIFSYITKHADITEPDSAVYGSGLDLKDS